MLILVVPVKYTISTSPLSVNGSSENGNCSSTTVNTDGIQVCNTPETSVLFDGVIPSLSDINTNMCWANQLLVLDVASSITFEFSQPSIGTFNTQGLEIVMINCPSENIGADTVRLYEGRHFRKFPNFDMSCDRLIRGCGSFQSITSTTIPLTFVVGDIVTSYVFIAEISFYQRAIDCS